MKPTRRAPRGEFRVAAASVDTNFGARDAHLRSADFFDAETYPDDHLRLDRRSRRRRRPFDVTGDLTIKDVTRPTTFEVELDGHRPGHERRRATPA